MLQNIRLSHHAMPGNSGAGEHRPGANTVIGGTQRLLRIDVIWGKAGFTLLELMIVVSLIMALAAIGVPTYLGYLQKARTTKAIADIRRVDRVIQYYLADMEELPDSLDDIGEGAHTDPWGNPYRYLLIDTTKKGQKALSSLDLPGEDLPFLGFLEINTVILSAVTGKKDKTGSPPGKGKDTPPGQDKQDDKTTGQDKQDDKTTGQDKQDDKTTQGNLTPRKDGSENPINLDYDLYSMGPDGDSKPNLSSKAGSDDIIRGSSGDYFGPANYY